MSSLKNKIRALILMVSDIIGFEEVTPYKQYLKDLEDFQDLEENHEENDEEKNEEDYVYDKNGEILKVGDFVRFDRPSFVTEYDEYFLVQDTDSWADTVSVLHFIKKFNSDNIYILNFDHGNVVQSDIDFTRIPSRLFVKILK